jgi:predicted nucleic acid-binding protein
MIVVDTNVWSEATKPDPDQRVRVWARQHDDQLYLAAVVIAELFAGAAILPVGKKRATLEGHFEELVRTYRNRILPFEERAARHYAQILERSKALGRPILTADAMIAATALAHGMKVATRDLGDFAAAQVELIDPWAE